MVDVQPLITSGGDSGGISRTREHIWRILAIRAQHLGERSPTQTNEGARFRKDTG